MYARVPTFKMSVESLDAAILHFERVTVPRLRELPGFKGATLLESSRLLGESRDPRLVF
jgi:hypothetical protein